MDNGKIEYLGLQVYFNMIIRIENELCIPLPWRLAQGRRTSLVILKGILAIYLVNVGNNNLVLVSARSFYAY